VGGGGTELEHPAAGEYSEDEESLSVDIFIFWDAAAMS
jgi:hypothetical protein